MRGASSSCVGEREREEAGAVSAKWKTEAAMEGARSCTGASGGGARERIRLSVPRVSVCGVVCVRVLVPVACVRFVGCVCFSFFFFFVFFWKLFSFFT